MRGSNNNNSGMVMLVGFSVLLSLTAVIAVAARWPDSSRTVTMMTPAQRTTMMAPATRATNLNVVMKDPGCHWLQTDSGLKTSTSVKGPVNLVNMDEAALRVVGPSGTVIDHVGRSVRLAAGRYAITMVGQAPDDNHLKLQVS